MVRELHDAKGASAARGRWEDLGYQTALGEAIQEDEGTASMVTEVDAIHTIRPLKTHPVVARAARLGGPVARWFLLSPASPISHRLCQRWGADRAPLVDIRPPELDVHERRALYVAKSLEEAERARTLDRMAADDADHDARELGRLLGYPDCCVEAFCALERRWPNRLPILAAAERTERFEPRLNNLALDRFAWIAHFPCRYDCVESLALANAAAESLSARSPELVAALDELLALPRVWWSDAKQGVLQGARWDGEHKIRFEELQSLDAIWPSAGEARRRESGEALNALAKVDRVRLTEDGA
ncbi:MAG: hypothetical protein VX938_01805, partial [Myxococcota bacterium]|nr:hypothetical protein [Myxococcota bacterium]